jgi:hypothetical protein
MLSVGVVTNGGWIAVLSALRSGRIYPAARFIPMGRYIASWLCLGIAVSVRNTMR